MEDYQTIEQAGEAPQGARWELPGYTHGRELGVGAAGRVVLARHDATGALVAIKYLNGESATYEGLRAEAKLLEALDSPYVARLYEYVEGPRGAAIVMELVDGVSLRDLLHTEGATAPEAALTVLKGSLLGLAAAHEAGVVHRDYKPGNVLVTVDGTSKLVDFGIAVRSGDAGTIAGTPAYMAPEQWTGEPASPATDVYAATATFFECLTGAKPYAGTTLMELAVAHTEAQIPEDQAPEALRPLIRAGLAKTPEGRPAGAAALVAELETVAGAAYGLGWEERGKGQLSALVVLLPLLLPCGGEQVTGTTSLATTELDGPDGAVTAGGPVAPARPGPRSGWQAKVIGTAAAGVVLVGGALAGISAAGADDSTGATRSAKPKLTASFGPVPGTGISATAAARPRASASQPSFASPSDSVSATGPSPTTAGTPKPSAPRTAKPGTSATAPAAPTPSRALLRVDTISLTVSCGGQYAAQAEGAVATDGAATGTLTVLWTDETGRQVASNSLALPQGQTSVSFSFTQPFGSARTLTARAITSPAAASGQNASGSAFDSMCNPPR
ncbi:protein kinase [Streptomyces sp. NPDC057909]|uniref:protein kinase domain-containing protein n=1 Tax=Streptomyces sp. NPDC057909 TaxID=3346277 RepID=UPI0036EDFCE0